jgi:hypothetical protein
MIVRHLVTSPCSVSVVRRGAQRSGGGERVAANPGLVLLVVMLFLPRPAAGQYVPAHVTLEQLPQEHAYQRSLRAYLGSLTEKELTVERRKIEVAPGVKDPEDLYRLWLLTLHLPDVSAATLPASSFTLAALEAGKGILLPAGPYQSQTLAWLAQWSYPGNPYLGDAALKRRAFVLAAVDLMLLDYLYEHAPQGSARSDYLGGNLIWIGYTYRHVKDVVPAEARTAMETGLKKHLHRLEKWGPTGAMTDMDLFAPVGLWYVAAALDDAAVTRSAEAYAKRLFTEERFFHPAGYFVDVGCFDTSYNGISLYFATWAALASDWPFAREAVDKGYRLRNHLSLPEPKGGANGPSHMSSRTSADPPHDQWNFPHRPYAAAMVTDEALHLAPLPAPEVLAGAAARVVGQLNRTLETPSPAKPQPWRESHWSGQLNFAHDHYRKGYYTRRLELAKNDSPLLKSVYHRPETFQREFGKAFLIARFDQYAAVVHTGPIRGWPNGLGGGMLSAFWTPQTGLALLGRRRGMQGHVKDSLDEWRTWPVHALSGVTAAGDFFTSAAIARPEDDYQVGEQRAEVRVGGPLRIGKDPAAMQYRQRFLFQPGGLTIQTTVHSAEARLLGELYETVPIFLHDRGQMKDAKVNVQFQVGEQWQEPPAGRQANVKAIRIERYTGAVLLTFDRPRSVQLAPREWVDGFQTAATCRTLLVDLLDHGGQPRAIDAAAVEYTLAPIRPPQKK